MLNKIIEEDLKTAQKNKDAVKVSTLRLLKSAMHNLSIERRGELKEEDIITVIRKEVKQRGDSIEKFKQGNRQDLVDKEKRELDILKGYLPKELGQEELTAIIKESIAETEAKDIKDMGKVMKVLIAKVKGRSDGKTISSLVSRELTTPGKD